MKIMNRSKINFASALFFAMLTIGCESPVRIPPLPDIDVWGVEDLNAPNELLFQWWGQNSAAESELVVVENETIENLVSGGIQAFDCGPYFLDEKLKRALQEAHQLRWLRFGNDLSSTDLEWICDLNNLEGLAFGGADFSDANMELLSQMSNLKWQVTGSEVSCNWIIET